jgi:thiosulfate dehydrogenase
MKDKVLIKDMHRAMICAWCIVFLLGLGLLLLMYPSFWTSAESKITSSNKAVEPKIDNAFWVPPDTSHIPSNEEGELIRYGHKLVARTSYYLGPHGKVQSLSNGMNCQNCHLQGGRKVFGNNYSAVASTYPKFRPRSGTIESIEKRVNDCIERSLNGKSLSAESLEMRAFVAYISWVGQNVPKGETPKGAGLLDLPLLNRAADANLGKKVFTLHCVRCHGENGEGMREEGSAEWKYPPLWGEHSYNIGAGLFRLSRFAGYVKANMPYDIASLDNPTLTDEEAWDVAAYVNSMPRPKKDISKDWPDISKKPFDHPFGPYKDTFSEEQHKFGPFIAIKESSKKK